MNEEVICECGGQIVAMKDQMSVHEIELDEDGNARPGDCLESKSQTVWYMCDDCASEYSKYGVEQIIENQT